MVATAPQAPPRKSNIAESVAARSKLATPRGNARIVSTKLTTPAPAVKVPPPAQSSPRIARRVGLVDPCGVADVHAFAVHSDARTVLIASPGAKRVDGDLVVIESLNGELAIGRCFDRPLSFLLVFPAPHYGAEVTTVRIPRKAVKRVGAVVERRAAVWHGFAGGGPIVGGEDFADSCAWAAAMAAAEAFEASE